MPNNELPDYCRELLNHTLLDTDETYSLMRRSKRGDKSATDKLVRHNMKLVYSVAKKYTFVMDIEDLMQEGICGLLKAIQDFRLSSKLQLSTYAKWWIIAFCRRASQRSSGYTSFQTARERGKIKTFEHISLPIDTENENGMTIGDLIESEEMPQDEAYLRNESDREVRRAVEDEVRGDRRLELIAKRLTGKDEPKNDLGTLGKKFNVSRERVRQIEVKFKSQLTRNRKLKAMSEG